MHIGVVDLKKLVLRRGEGGAGGHESGADDLLRVEEGDEHIALPSGIQRPGAVEGGTRHGHMPEIVHDRHVLLRARQTDDSPQLVGALIDAAVKPVHEGVSPRLIVVEINHPEDVALGGEIDLDRVVHATERVPLHIAAVGLAGPDARRQAFVHDGPVFLDDVVTLAAVAPVEPAVGMQKRAVHIRRVTVKRVAPDDHLALIGHAVAVGVRQFPDARRRCDVERAIKPRAALRKRHLVGEHRTLVVDAIAVRVLEHHDLVGQLLLQPLPVEIQPGRIAHEEPPVVVNGAHHRVIHQWWRRRDDELEAFRHLGFRQGRHDAGDNDGDPRT